jgi:hypothetical protein
MRPSGSPIFHDFFFIGERSTGLGNGPHFVSIERFSLLGHRLGARISQPLRHAGTAALEKSPFLRALEGESDGNALKPGCAEEIVNFPQAGKNNDRKISQEEFQRACNLGLVNNAALDQPSSPTHAARCRA